MVLRKQGMMNLTTLRSPQERKHSAGCHIEALCVSLCVCVCVCVCVFMCALWNNLSVYSVNTCHYDWFIKQVDGPIAKQNKRR